MSQKRIVCMHIYYTESKTKSMVVSNCSFLRTNFLTFKKKLIRSDLNLFSHPSLHKSDGVRDATYSRSHVNWGDRTG